LGNEDHATIGTVYNKMKIVLPLILICIAMQILIIFTDLPH